MPEGRFYLNSTLTEGQTVSLTDEEMHHLQVMRPKLEDSIELINGQGDLAAGIITSIEKRAIYIEIESATHFPPPSFVSIIAQGMPRPNRLEMVIEKGTELGMTELWLFPAEKSEKKDLSESGKSRLEKILIASMKQCGRLYLPQIKWLNPISSWAQAHHPLFFGTFKENTPSFQEAWKTISPKSGAIFATGPESGLTAKEEAHLEKLNGQGVCLHPNILRTDTASIAALVQMQLFQ